jgi:hypothetical protein
VLLAGAPMVLRPVWVVAWHGPTRPSGRIRAVKD